MTKISNFISYAKRTQLGKYATGAVNNVYSTYSGIAKNTIKGAKIGKRSARLSDDNVLTSAYKVVRGVVRKNTLTKEDIPALMGGLGAVAGGAIPGTTTIGYTLGLLIKKGIGLFVKK